MILRDLEDVLLAVGVAVWLGGAVWEYRDAQRRIGDPFFRWTATALGLVPVAGPLAYLLVRPPETLDEVLLRRLELRELEAALGEHGPRCPVCRAAVEDAFRVCPVCTTRLKEPCRGCGCLLEPHWLACPWCAAPALEATPLEAAPDEADLDTALTAEAATAAVAPRLLER